jgi:asparagine N-glycosylation enzyme membrane subunit Stt3
MKDHTPPLPYPTDQIYTRDEYDPYKAGNYGIFTGWDYGNIVNQRGHRIPSWSRWSQPSNEKLLVDPADSLLYKITKEHINYKYLVVSLSMVKNFMAKYKILDYPLDPCYGSKTINYNGNPTTLNVYGECFQNSLLYNTYVERDTSLSWIKEVYRSDIEIIYGYIEKQGDVSIIGFDARAYKPDDVAKILERGYIGTREGLLYDLHLSPEIVIYEILDPSPILSPIFK